MAQLLALLQRIPNWVAAGDWNVDLDKFASTNIATEAQGQVIGCKEAAISSGNTLDFVLASRSVAGLLQLRVDKVVPFAPHCCLQLAIDLEQGLLNLPTLKGFPGIQRMLKPGNSELFALPTQDNATLETGDSPLRAPSLGASGDGPRPVPPQRPAQAQFLDIGGALLEPCVTTLAFATFSRSVELELFGKVQGRGASNPVEYRPALRDDRHASRWHGRPAALLSQIARLATALVQQQPAPPELLGLTLQYLSEERAEATTPEWAADLGLVDSKAPTSRPALSKELVTSIVTGIKQELSLSRLQVSQRSKESYEKWLSDNSVGGLKPLYKCIRKYEASVERPFSTFSAASKLLLRLQQWSQLWKSSGTKPEPCFEDLKRRACEQAQALPAITGDRVEQYMRRAPLKAPGPDGWTPHLMRALTAEQCHRLASIMRQAELNGSFPEQWSVSLVILLPKNLEIERPIALMHVLLKAWMKLRWCLLEQWQESFASQGWWDSCGPGHSCLDVAVRRLIQYESSQIVPEHRITLYLDLSCFYETIIHARLVAHAQEVGFPPLLLWGALCAYRGPRLLSADGLVGPPAYASRGVLAGCPIAVALSKVALWPACNAVLNQPAVATADTWVDDLSVDFCGPNPHQVAAKGLRVAKTLFAALEAEGLEVSLKKTTWIASSPAVEAALKKQSKGEATQVSSVAKDLGVANAAGRARRTQAQAKRLRKGSTRGTRLQSLRVRSVAHRVRVSKMGSLSAAIWGHQGLGLSPKQLRGLRTQAAQAGRRQKLGSVDVVFSLGEGNCCDPLRTVILQHWRTLHKLLFAQPMPDKYRRLWKITWSKLQKAPKRWALVKGPIAAMVAYLQDLGVEASDPTTWRFPKGSLRGPGLWKFEEDTVTVQPGLSTEHQVKEGLSRLLQSAANRRISQQDAGTGTISGVDWTVPRRLTKSQAKRPNHLTALRMVWQGGFFTTTKGAKRRCPLCHKPADLRHVLLECQWWRGRGPSPPSHWQKLQARWPAESLWVRGLPPAEYTAFPPLAPGATAPRRKGIWSQAQIVDAGHLVFGTDATGTTNDPRTRVVAAAVVACTLCEGHLKEVGCITQVLPPGCSVVQGEALALALLLRHTTGKVAVTVDCRPAILQAGGTSFRAAHTNVWEDVWEERHRLLITWHPSHRSPREYEERYGASRHWRVQLNELADKACKDAAAEIPWRQHAAAVAQIDEVVEEVAHFLAGRAWTMLAGAEAPPLDLKPRNKPRSNLPLKPKGQLLPEPKPPQTQHRPAPGGGANKKQRLEALLATEHLHGHRFAWSHTNPTNHSLKCSTCSLYIQQVHPAETFSRLEAQPCAHWPVPDLSRFQLHQSHSFYNMGAVLLCTKCFAVHKPGQLTLTKVVKTPCEGASRAHAKRQAYWAQKYLAETTAPANLFGGKGAQAVSVESRAVPTPPSLLPRFQAKDSDDCSQSGSTGCGPHTCSAVAKAGRSTLDTALRGKTEWPQGLTQPFEAGEPPSQLPLVFPQALAQAPLEAPVTKPKCAQGSVAGPPRSSAPKPQPKIKNRKEPDPSSQLKLSQVFGAQAKQGVKHSNASSSGLNATPR